MADTEYTALQIQELCNELNWARLSEREDPRFDSGMLRRYLVLGTNQNAMSAVTLAAVKAYLKTLTSIANPYADQKPVAGTWQCGPMDVVQGDGGEWRLVHTLFKVATQQTVSFLGEDGCTYQSTRYFYINQATVPAHPVSPAAGNGTRWDQNFSFDYEQGLWNGWWEARTRLTTALAPYTAADDTFETVTRQQFLGVRADGKDHLGAAVTIPSQATAAAGSLVEQSKSKNDDCTHDVAVDTRALKSVTDVVKSVEESAFERTEEAQDDGASAPGTAPTVPIDGEIKTVTNQKLRTPGRYSVKTVRRICHPRELTPYVSEVTDFTTRLTTKKWEQDEAPDATMGERVDAELTPFNKVNFTKVAEALRDDLEQLTWTTLGGLYTETAYTTWRLSTPLKEPAPQLVYYTYPSATGLYRRKYDHTLDFHNSLGAAITAIDGGQEGSGYTNIANGLWMSHRIDERGDLVSATTHEDPYEDYRVPEA